jgi:Tol biopolymer transport system component
MPLPQCAVLQCPFNADTLLTQVQLMSGVLRVRDVDGLGNDLAALPVQFAGRELDTTRHPEGVPGVTIIHAFPFQRRFNVWRMPVFRPAWSPDGTRLLYSDGLGLNLWTPGAAPVPIPNTEDGAWPAWSPDGQTIAYTRLIRGGSTQYICTCWSQSASAIEVQERTVYPGWEVEGTLTVINPDGSGKRELGAGEGPAWLPDGRIVVTRGARLWIVSADGVTIAEIPNTDFPAAPAISPDGKYIAFTRQNGERDWDIWVVPVPGGAQ